MSILGTLAGALEGAANLNNPSAGGTAAPGATPVGGGLASGLAVTQILSMIQQHPGGLSGILQSLQQGGLGHLVESWVGNGQNLPVSPDQLRNTLGADWIQKVTQLTGLSQSDVEQHLSTVLPQIVDHLSPNGQLPQGNDLGNELAGLAQRFLNR